MRFPSLTVSLYPTERKGRATSRSNRFRGSRPAAESTPRRPVPAFSPHDLRHRRISLLHLAGVPWARIGVHVGQRSLRVTADTYSHVLVDENSTTKRMLA